MTGSGRLSSSREEGVGGCQWLSRKLRIDKYLDEIKLDFKRFYKFNQEGRNCDQFKRNVIETRGRRRRRSSLEQFGQIHIVI